eukprot:CAMPEP_0119411604 /NCGR_PEP_ID=MMETSP1335-20130426/4297_1 /TAXON_ID=259385 /ORGANISM="Chrysoculter rhomboideus, Strain RCC1486" /LENGTH=238 /DNA_ID=CAMNT_0007436261 /DNA_START=1 /DNA_END=717 /DNA_ORIENTATION=+
MGVCSSKPKEGAADRVWGAMPQSKVDASMNKAIATKMDRIPPLDRARVWSAEEIAALSSSEQPWGEVTDDPRGVRFSYPTTWDLIGPVAVSKARYERLVRTAHVLNEQHARCTAEMSVGLVYFNGSKPTEPISIQNFDKMTAQISDSASRLPGGALLTHETLPAGVFKSSTHHVVHNVSQFAQPDATTTRVEQWMMLSKDRTTMCTITLFNSDLSAHETYGEMQRRYLESVQLPEGKF